MDFEHRKGVIRTVLVSLFPHFLPEVFLRFWEPLAPICIPSNSGGRASLTPHLVSSDPH